MWFSEDWIGKYEYLGNVITNFNLQSPVIFDVSFWPLVLSKRVAFLFGKVKEAYQVWTWIQLVWFMVIPWRLFQRNAQEFLIGLAYFRMQEFGVSYSILGHGPQDLLGQFEQQAVIFIVVDGYVPVDADFIPSTESDFFL